MLNPQVTKDFINQIWDTSVIPTLQDYIRIPCKSPAFDANWQQTGFIDKAAELLTQWCQQHAAIGMQLEVVRLSNRTPVIFIEIPGQVDDTILLYGHFDKQPEISGWDSDLGPWTPVIKGDRLYGRGASDDGYSIFSALSAVLALQNQQVAHPRCVIMIEGCEESGSTDLPFYVEHLRRRIGTPSLVICLDSGCGNYEQLWGTTSLRGLVNGKLTVEILKHGVHSGAASGIVPSSFRIERELLSRIEDEKTGAILVDELHVSIPPERIQEAELTAKILGEQIIANYPFVDGAGPVTNNPTDLLLNHTWRPALSVIGAEGLPAADKAGNVLRPRTVLSLSMRLPPTCDSEKAAALLKRILETDPPYGAKVSFEIQSTAAGWNAPPLNASLAKSITTASEAFFGKPSAYMGEGGTIPFMAMLGEKFPQAQFLITGVLGPQSNAHGPNEFLHIPTAKNVTACVAWAIAGYAS